MASVPPINDRVMVQQYGQSCPLADKNRDFDCERYRLISTDGHPKLAYTALSTSIVCDRRY
jgi:hypothetical protein